MVFDVFLSQKWHKNSPLFLQGIQHTFMDYRIVENYFINRLVGEEGRRFFASRKTPAGRRLKKSKTSFRLLLGSYRV